MREGVLLYKQVVQGGRWSDQGRRALQTALVAAAPQRLRTGVDLCRQHPAEGGAEGVSTCIWWKNLHETKFRAQGGASSVAPPSVSPPPPPSARPSCPFPPPSTPAPLPARSTKYQGRLSSSTPSPTSALTLGRHHQPAPLARAAVHRLHNVDKLLLVVHRPVDLVVVASAQVDHDVLRARDEGGGGARV